ncbi:NAD(P)-dependent alcohol dehydrogenase [Actinotalea sp. Marseille-Q4924]|uniref:NAD(P)-dependent alcohol dehydrogenase n=1 Tax=Actinotalea sp. Marseille-Q4924 TaxID=2866571 RepID=UPI001CE4931A|nr:NAD(P)-dependent alcohol dehydrogenase [Actinotalea sp. Marseille-Q4924]
MSSSQPAQQAAATSRGPTIRAAVRAEYGGPEVVEVRDVPTPAPSRRQVLLRVVAAGVDRGQVHMMTGTPSVMRVATGLRRPRQSGLGLEVAGIVEAVGPDVTGLAVGDTVYGAATSSFAERAVADPRKLARVPTGVDPVRVAALPVSGLTALQALRDVARVQPGHRALVIGASGGVGSYAVQLAVAMGCDVVGVCSAAKADLVRALGATEVIAHDEQDLPTDGSFDAVLDIAGGRPVTRLRQALRSSGTLVLVGDETGGPVTGNLGRQIRASLASLVGRRGPRVRMFVSSTRTADLQELAGYVERGQVRPTLQRTFPLEETAAALAHVQEGRVRGKVVVQVSNER